MGLISRVSSRTYRITFAVSKVAQQQKELKRVKVEIVTAKREIEQLKSHSPQSAGNAWSTPKAIDKLTLEIEQLKADRVTREKEHTMFIQDIMDTRNSSAYCASCSEFVQFETCRVVSFIQINLTVDI